MEPGAPGALVTGRGAVHRPATRSPRCCCTYAFTGRNPDRPDLPRHKVDQRGSTWAARGGEHVIQGIGEFERHADRAPGTPGRDAAREDRSAGRRDRDAQGRERGAQGRERGAARAECRSAAATGRELVELEQAAIDAIDRSPGRPAGTLEAGAQRAQAGWPARAQGQPPRVVAGEQADRVYRLLPQDVQTMWRRLATEGRSGAVASSGRRDPEDRARRSRVSPAPRHLRLRGDHVWTVAQGDAPPASSVRAC